MIHTDRQTKDTYRLMIHTDRQTKDTDRLMIQTDRLKHRQKDYETERLMTQKINGIDRRYRHRLKTQKHRLTDGQKIEIDQRLTDRQTDRSLID